MNNELILKDDKLNSIYVNNYGNIAQFISISPEKNLKYVYINNFYETYERLSLRDLILVLIKSARSRSVNIRSFSISNMKGNKLIYNKTEEDIAEILEVINQNCINGKYSIINENIDINDGGVSGVMLSNIAEFAPKDTPKCVDKEGVCILPKDMANYMFEKIYGFKPKINFPYEYRVEFSIHPNREGYSKEHTIIWEYELFGTYNESFRLSWPNKFSEFIGDKVFGLLIADYLNLNVPNTFVIAREVAPFQFGKDTGSYEKWIRTCPITKEPGKYYSGMYWTDPFVLLDNEEKNGFNKVNIASILSQQSVEAVYSGASIVRNNSKKDIVEGVEGYGNNFMLGVEEPLNVLPIEVLNKVKQLNDIIRDNYYLLGDVSIEWVYDGKKVWVVQLNQIKTSGYNNIIVDGNPKYYRIFDVKEGLESLRKLIWEIKDDNIGISLKGNIGITSHFGDLLRQKNIPSKVIKDK